jgi:hypothetical protein
VRRKVQTSWVSTASVIVPATTSPPASRVTRGDVGIEADLDLGGAPAKTRLLDHTRAHSQSAVVEPVAGRSRAVIASSKDA